MIQPIKIISQSVKYKLYPKFPINKTQFHLIVLTTSVEKESLRNKLGPGEATFTTMQCYST